MKQHLIFGLQVSGCLRHPGWCSKTTQNSFHGVSVHPNGGGGASHNFTNPRLISWPLTCEHTNPFNPDLGGHRHLSWNLRRLPLGAVDKFIEVGLADEQSACGPRCHRHRGTNAPSVILHKSGIIEWLIIHLLGRHFLYRHQYWQVTSQSRTNESRTSLQTWELLQPSGNQV